MSIILLIEIENERFGLNVLHHLASYFFNFSEITSAVLNSLKFTV